MYLRSFLLDFCLPWSLWFGFFGRTAADFCWFEGYSSFCEQLQYGSVKINYMLILMECVSEFVVFILFLVVGRLFPAYHFFLIAHQHVSCRTLASKISLSALWSDGQNLSWLSRFFLFVVFRYMGCCLLRIVDVLSWY